MVKFAGTGGFTTTTSKYITSWLHAPPTMPLIERDYNYRWNYPCRIVDEHRRPNTTIKYRAHVHWNAWANSKIEWFAMLTFQNPSTTSRNRSTIFQLPSSSPSRNGVSKASRRFSTQNPAINPAYHNDRGRNKYCRQTPPNGERHFGVDFDDIVYGDYVRDIMEIPASTRLFMGNRHAVSIAVRTDPAFLWYIGHVTVP